MKVLFTTNVPSPYRVDFFNALGKLCDLTVLFETQAAKSRDTAWVADKITNFKAVFMKGYKYGEAEAVCFEVLHYLSLKKYDKIIVGMYSSVTGMLAIEYMKARRIPFILSSDGGIKKQEIGPKRWIKAHFISAASVWLSTGKITSEYLEYYGAKKDKIFIYPFTSVRECDILDKPISVEEKKKFRNRLGMCEQTIVLSVGQFIYRKGYDILLSACKKIGGDIGVYIVGGTPTEEYLKMKAELPNDNVHFVKFMPKEKLSEYYKAADIFVLPTREDIWGLVVNEAMAYALPVITTVQCVSGTEMINPEVTGSLLAVGDQDGIVEKIYSWRKYDRNEVLSTARKYSIEAMAKAHIDFLSNI